MANDCYTKMLHFHQVKNKPEHQVNVE